MQDNRKFNDVVNDIESAENDVDKVLKAARLERHKGARMSAEQKTTIILALIVTFGALMFFFMMFVLPVIL